jgi:hypothetical protein
LDVSRLTREFKRSILLPLGGALAAFAAIGLGHLANHPEDFTRNADAVALVAPAAEPSFDVDFTQSQGLIGDAARPEARAAKPQPHLEQVRTALERDMKMDEPRRSQGPLASPPDSTEGPVFLLEP